MKGYHYLMRMAHLFNTLARFARHLKAASRSSPLRWDELMPIPCAIAFKDKSILIRDNRAAAPNGVSLISPSLRI